MTNGYSPQTQFEQFVCDKLQTLLTDVEEIKDRACCKQFPRTKEKVATLWWAFKIVGGCVILTITGSVLALIFV